MGNKTPVDLEQTRRNMAFLAKALDILNSSLDYKKTLQNVTSLAVPEIADWCSVDMIDSEGHIQPVSIAHRDPAKVKWAWQLRNHQEQGIDLNADTGSGKVLRTGESEFYPKITDAMLVAGARDERELALMRELRLSAIIIVPLKLHGRTVGVLNLVSAEQGRYYTEDDLHMAEELASGASLAMTNADLYRTARRELAERRRLERELRQANETLEARVAERTRSLQAASRAKDEFIALASHQLRTPATAVKQYVGMILQGYAGDVDSRQRALLTVAYESNERQLKVVNDLLRVARLDLDQVKLRPAATDIGELVRDIVSQQAPHIEKKKVEVTLHSPGKPVVTTVDPDHFGSALDNIIDNAIKYTPEGKNIDIDIGRTDGHVVIHIRDQGVGIAKDDLKRLFKKFSRIENSLSVAVGGTGLGLYWAKEIIGLHGGRISVTSTVGRGSTFTVTIPASVS